MMALLPRFFSATLLLALLATSSLESVNSEVVESNDGSKFLGGADPAFPAACVKFAVFDNPHCWGNPKRVVQYPTYTDPGHSPCFGDPTHPWASLGDQYCNLGRQVYHFEFYPLNGKCQGDPVKLDIPTDGECKVGIKVYQCKVKLCLPEEDCVVVGNIGHEMGLIQLNYERLSKEDQMRLEQAKM